MEYFKIYLHFYQHFNYSVDFTNILDHIFHFQTNSRFFVESIDTKPEKNA